MTTTTVESDQLAKRVEIRTSQLQEIVVRVREKSSGLRGLLVADAPPSVAQESQPPTPGWLGTQLDGLDGAIEGLLFIETDLDAISSRF